MKKRVLLVVAAVLVVGALLLGSALGTPIAAEVAHAQQATATPTPEAAAEDEGATNEDATDEEAADEESTDEEADTDAMEMETMAQAERPDRLSPPLSAVVTPGAGTLPDGADQVELVKVVDGLVDPVNVVSANDGSGRLFVVERLGRVRIVEEGELLEEPFLDISDSTMIAMLEQGLYDIAFHPDYAENGLFYVHFAELMRNGDSMIVQYSVSGDDPNVADADSARVIMQIDQPWANHNGGELAFGPDGYLYIGSGDGGWEGDPLGAGQDLSTLLGKILRIEVTPDGDEPYAIPADNPFADNAGLVRLFGLDEEFFAQLHTDAMPEIWAYGLRNPWKFSFDSVTGDMYIAEVGQNVWEEIDYIPADSEGGINFGWDFLMGSHCFPVSQESCAPVGTLPIAEYNHELGCAVIGIGVYRGETNPEWDGVYYVGDYCSGLIWGLNQGEDGEWAFREVLDTGLRLTGSGEGEDGELYVTSCECTYGSGAPAQNPPGALWQMVHPDQVDEEAETAPRTDESASADDAENQEQAADNDSASATSATSSDVSADYVPLTKPGEVVGAPNPAMVVSEGANVRWILPGPRALDPDVFGTPEQPLGFQDEVGVPLDQRAVSADGEQYTTTKGPTAHSDAWAPIEGSMEASVVDITTVSALDTRDEITATFEFTSPDGAHEYRVVVDEPLTRLPYETFGGVGLNVLLHGSTGVGTMLQPQQFGYLAFWGIGDFYVDDELASENRVVHLMVTEQVRSENYALVFNEGVIHDQYHAHLLMPPLQVGEEGPPQDSPLPTEFTLPNGDPQPFLHIMYEEIDALRGDVTMMNGMAADEADTEAMDEAASDEAEAETDEEAAENSEQAAEAALMIDNQPLTGQTLTVQEVTVPELAWIVVRYSGNIIGTQQVESGTTEQVKVALSEEVPTGEQVRVVLHRDTGTEGTFEPGNQSVDQPIRMNNRTLFRNIRVTMPETEGGTAMGSEEGAQDSGEGIELVAEGIGFLQNEITVQAGEQVTIQFINRDRVPHNFAAYRSEDASDPIFVGRIITGPDATATYTFQAPEEPGEYYFQCDVHPVQMTGVFIVEE